jgi:hypothetical protein
MPADQREADMDWDLAIRRNREALLSILAALFALVGLPEGALAPTSPLWGGRRGERSEADPGGGCDPAIAATLPLHLHAYALRVLRAAESAIRRLIVIAARDIAVQPRPAGERPDFAALSKWKQTAEANAPVRIPAFPLLDPLKRCSFKPPRRFSKSFPRICVPGYTEPAPIPVKPVLRPDDPVDATSLCRRLLSSRRALANLPREARRLARWKERNKLKPGRRRVVPPLRIGRPPGGRKHPTHAVDHILKECQALALDVLSPLDTS